MEENEKIKQLWRKAWEKLNHELQYSGGVNPHAYRYGYLDGYNAALQSIHVNEVKEDSEENFPMPTKEEFTFNGELIQPHYDNAMKAWGKLKSITRKVKEEDKPTPLIPDMDLEYFKKHLKD